MKCGRKSCEKEAPDGRHYCSKSCARQDVDSEEESDTSSIQKPEQSFTKAPGDISAKLSEEEAPIESGKNEGMTQRLRPSGTNETRRSLQINNESGESAGAKDERKPSQSDDWLTNEPITNNTERSGMTGTKETVTASAERSLTVGSSETPPTDSTDSLMALKAVMLPSVTLLDSSANFLHEQMKSFGTQCEETNKEKERATYTTQQIGAVCNLAKNVNQLIRTKLDIAKELRK